MYSQSRIKTLGAAALLVSSLHLAGCGGSDDDDSPAPQPTSNNKPTVSISSDAEVIEGSELSVTATATDSDGSITSYAWKYISGPQVELSGSDDKQVSFTAPDIEVDEQLVLEVTVTDDKGATATAAVTINIKRKALSVTITGIVTDEPIASPNVAVMVGDEEFQIIADDSGKYSIEIEVDDSYANKLVRLVALGNNSINPEVEFISQLRSVATLVSQAGDDGKLTKDENFGVNITNVTTAEFALLSRDNTEVEDEQALDKALLAVDADEKLLLAALIKIIVDNDAYELPEGIDSTLDLIGNADDIENFINSVNSKDSELIETVKQTIKEDDELVDGTVGAISGQYILMAPKFYSAAASQLDFNDDGTGTYSSYEVNATFTWQQQENDISISLTEPALVSCSYPSDGSEQQEECIYLNALGLTVLLENEANKSVEFFSEFETKITGNADTKQTNSSTSNLTLIPKERTLAIPSSDLIGTWYVERVSRLYGFSEAISLNLAEGGTGTLVDNTKAPIAINWSVTGNQLMVTSEAEELSFNYSFWLIKDVTVGYHFVASLEAKDDSATRTANGLMVKDNSLAFEGSALLGKWTIYQGQNVPQTDLHYDVYEDGLMNFNLDQNYRSWAIDSEGKFIRNNYYTDSGVQPVCDNPNNDCVVYSEFSQQLLAENNGHYYTYRKYRFFNNDGSERVEDYSSHIREFSVSAEYGVAKFAPYWLENNSGFDANGYPTDENYITLYTPKERAVASVTIATTYNAELDKNEYTLTQQYQGATTENNYTLAAGKILFGTMKAEISDFDRDYLTVCVYAQSAMCTEADKQRWYFDVAKAQQQIVVVRPTPAHPLDGAWQLADEPDVVVVLRDGKWIQVQSLAKDDEDDGFAGYEYGDFTWNADTGEFSVQLEDDTNGNFGLNDTGAKTLTVDGDVMTLNIEDEGEVIFSRIYDPSNPLVGAYIEGSISGGDFFMAVFKEDGYFIELEHTQEYDPGITGSTYTVASDPSGDPSTLSVTVDYFTNQLDGLSEADPYFVVQPRGNKIIWHDGDDFGVMQRVTDVDANEIEFTEEDVLGQHILRYVTDDGTGQVDLAIDIMTNDARFEINGELRVVEWSIELGQLKLYSPLELEGDSAYGVVISPQAVINGGDGFAVSVFGFEAPDNHPDMEDPELFINVAGSMLKQ